MKKSRVHYGNLEVRDCINIQETKNFDSSLEMVRNYVNIYQNEMYNNFDQINPLESVTEYKSKLK